MYKTNAGGARRRTDGYRYRRHFARHGHRVRLYDTDPSRLAEVPAVAAAILHELQESGQFDVVHQQAVLARLAGTTSLSDPAESTLLIEAIPERLPLKHALYAQLETLIADDAIIASNTSGLPPDSFCGGHAPSAATINRPLLAPAALYSAGGGGARQRHARSSPPW